MITSTLSGMRRCRGEATLVATLFLLGIGWIGDVVAQAEPAHVASRPDVPSAAEAAAIAEYWTPERMANAIPRNMAPPAAVAPTREGESTLAPPTLPAGGMPGFDPDALEPPPYYPMPDLTDAPMPGLSEGPTEDVAAPASASYPSAHTTYEFQGRYLTWPRSPVGKLFLVLNGGNWQCSATLIGRRHVVTAGHCVSDGAGHWATNVQFCPSYDIGQGGPNPTVGCWTTNIVTTASRWHSNGEPDADIGMAIYGNSGTVRNDYPGNIAGWLGYAWNWGVGQHEEMFGYPAADRPANAHNEFADFNGGKIYVTSAEEAGYTINWGTYHDSKFLGTTQTPGCSGGPWVFRYGRKYLNTWNSNAVNGVNSTQRCWDDNPPCADRYLEISSPQFILYTDDGNCTLPNCGVVDTIVWTLNNYP